MTVNWHLYSLSNNNCGKGTKNSTYISTRDPWHKSSTIYITLHLHHYHIQFVVYCCGCGWYVIPDTQYALTRKHHFFACTLYIAGCLLAALTPRHIRWLNFSSSHFTRESVSFFRRRWRMGNKLSWLCGWSSPRFPPQVQGRKWHVLILSVCHLCISAQHPLQFSVTLIYRTSTVAQLMIHIYMCVYIYSSFGGLGVACWPLVPKFAGSNPAKAVRFFRAKKSSARLPSEGK